MPPTDDLWPAIEESQAEMPITTLREQAALLGPKTQNLVEARVDTRTAGDTVQHRFLLVAPALDHYTYHLFTLSHAVPEVYPANLGDLDDATIAALPHQHVRLGKVKNGHLVLPATTIHDANELRKVLRIILNSDRTKGIVSSLLAHSRASA